MSTFAIVRHLMILIQGQGHPIYRAALKQQTTFHVNMSAIGGCGLIVLLVLAPVIVCVESAFGVYISGVVNIALVTLLVIAGAVLSLSWTVPLTILAGQGIARERVTQTWDTLLITPFDTESIVLAKAASSVRNVWSLVVGLAFFGTLLALFFVSPVIASMGSQINQSLVVGVILMVIGMVAIVLEHEQEIALSVMLGIFVALKTDSQRMALIAGLAVGFLIRVVQLVLTFLVVPSITLLSLQNIVVMNFIAGSATLLAVLPMTTAVSFVIAMIIGRELLVRWLFHWITRHASGW
jgi:hypothetical protein